ncbi:flavodoxin family protein [Pelotomaculum propionicicum]|uniref:flavodoxin family protein n=1 Tax=Pelotomaculum propionicicum TaxID=258475 RepID=UPI003B803E73
MKVIAFNGSPRKDWNTATLLKKALDGAASKGAETELVHLYDLDYKGCRSCFACKAKGGKSYGRCAAVDGLTPVLKKAVEADALLLGAPVYMGAVNGAMQSFIERLAYPYLVYDGKYSSLFKKSIKTGLIYTLGANEDRIKQMGYDRQSWIQGGIMKMIFGSSETLLVTDTYQFDDYSKYETSGIDVEAKTRVRKEVFPLDCEKAFEMGIRLVQQP